MISCPNCGKDIADDSVHCGYCGQEIVPGGGKKTIMGFGAITEDVLRKAAEEAKEARAQAEKEAEKQSAGAAGGFGERVESKLKIPKPVLPPSTEQDTAARTAPGKLSIPKLGIGIDDTADAKTEAMEPIASERSAPATIEEDVSSVVAPPEDTSAREPAGETDWRVSQTDPPGSWTGPGESTPDDWSMGEPDGSVRLTAPLSPALHLGARRIIAIALSSATFMLHR